MKTFRFKLILTFLLYGILISLISVGVIYNFYSSNLKTVNTQKALYKFDTLKKIFFHNINSAKLKLSSLENSQMFDSYLENKNKEYINGLFLTTLLSSNEIMQLRYLDIKGKEKIRVERNDYNTKPFIVKEELLQNKKSRYYFKQISMLGKGEIWYSKIDLNKERGKVERPIKPVLRLGMPVFKNNKKIGILILNLFVEEILKTISDNQLFNIYLIDKEGYFLLHKNKHFNWSKYLNNHHTLKDQFNSYKEILSKNLFINNNFISKDLEFDNKENIKVIIEPKLFYVQNQLIEHMKELLITLFSLVILSFPLAYFFARNPSKLKEQVDKFNETLEEQIQQRTKELYKSNRRLEKLATLDFLTQIPNRRYFFSMGKKNFAMAKRNQITISMLVMDIDFFKRVNDTYGHKTGDEVLILISKCLNDNIRQEDILARVGGEEFAIILTNASKNESMEIAEKIRELIKNTTYTNENITINLSMSIGITNFKKEDKDLTSLYDRADQALYMAKEAGRNCVKTV